MRVFLTLLLLPVAALTLSAAASQEPSVENRVMELLERTSHYIASLDAYRLRIEESLEIDEDEDGVLLQYENVQEMVVRRPDGLVAAADSDLMKRSFWFDGKTFTILDRGFNVYTTGPAPNDFTGLLDVLRNDYGFVGPLVELLFRDLAQLVRDNAQSASYVGIHTVGTRRAHHIHVLARTIDWQLWVDTGERPLPRKLALTFKQEEGEPRYTATFKEWDVEPTIAADAFTFVPPEGARKLDLNVPAQGSRPPE